MNSLAVAAPTVNVPAPSPRLCWAAGFEAYMARRPYEEMVDEHMRKGWIAAMCAAADCETSGYLAKVGA